MLMVEMHADGLLDCQHVFEDGNKLHMRIRAESQRESLVPATIAHMTNEHL